MSLNVLSFDSSNFSLVSVPGWTPCLCSWLSLVTAFWSQHKGSGPGGIDPVFRDVIRTAVGGG